MAKPRHLPNAPITEALIDVRVNGSDGLDIDKLAKSVELLDFGYYVKGPISEGTFAFKLTPDGQNPETAAASRQVGFRLHSADDKYVVQWQLGGFTLSRLEPYQNWMAILAEFNRVFPIYCGRLTPRRIQRVATRFINNLRLPMEFGASFRTYLNKVVDVPKRAPQAVEGFLQRFQLVDADSGARVNLTLSFNGAPGGQSLPVVLDVDAYMNCDLDLNDAKFEAVLGDLHSLKNRVFFGTITERAAELYE